MGKLISLLYQFLLLSNFQSIIFSWETVWDHIFLEGSNSTSLSPFSRRGHSLQNWEQERKLILYGGMTESGDVLSELWIFDTESSLINSWHEVAQNETCWPNPFVGHFSKLRPGFTQMVMFGGVTVVEGDFALSESSRVWTLHLDRMIWEIDPEDTSAPPNRAHSSGDIYNDALYMYGGLDFESNQVFQDLWRYDLEFQEWELLSFGPSAIYGHAMCTFEASLILHGGFDSSFDNNLDGIWIFDILQKSWTQLSGGQSLARSFHTLVPFSNSLWLFGGIEKKYNSGNGYAFYIAYNSLHVRSLKGSSDWKQYTVTTPSPRYDHDAALTKSGTLYISFGTFNSPSDVISLLSLNLSIALLSTEDAESSSSSIEIEEENPSVSSNEQETAPELVVGGTITPSVIGFIVTSTLLCSLFTLCYVYTYRSSRTAELPQLRTELQEQTPGLSEEDIKKLPTEKYRCDKGEEKTSSNLNENCPICLLDFEEDMEVLHLPCHHLFHPECITMWLQGKATCPMCKKELDPSSGSTDPSLLGIQDVEALDSIQNVTTGQDQPSSASRDNVESAAEIGVASLTQ